MALRLTVNGQVRHFGELAAGVSLVEVVAAMSLKGDRIAVEYNGEIAQRTSWAEVRVSEGDRLEVVHFVGGGSAGSGDGRGERSGVTLAGLAR